MKLYNTLTRTLEDFTPQDKNHVKIYTCGPTVYSYAHIGNFTSYIYWDLLLRTLKMNGYTPYRVLNFTDVGHLTSDSDDGEDKMEKGARREGKTVWEIAEHYEEAFLKDYRALNLLAPDKIAKATDYIAQDINLINTLTEKGYTYEIPDGVYYDTSKFAAYPDFARLNLDHQKAGARVAINSDKKNPEDFALWKFIQPGENHAMRWDYLDRPGYPGWHIECSAIIHTELGETIDIHTGGIDHIPVHHTNEIAQSEAAYGKRLSNYWLHCNHITIDGEKVSKSLGNTYTLDELSAKGFSPLDFKLWVLQGHYQSERNFSFTDLAAAKSRRLSWRNKIAAEMQLSAGEDFAESILAATSDNLNSAEAFALIDRHNLDIGTWRFVDDLFGLGLMDSITEPTAAQKQLIADREQARKDKDFQKADAIRDQLAAENITVLDTSDGPIWQYLA
ncbi:cysteine--tRNA ligase [Candidatus Saccharibacteria bacterium]|nr:cysteine--tRNA ligase [Candidatus Saccharibacteria bacterium]